ncbi:MAG: c-type cytochrome domain-containing protein [Verrucomicrobiales bacterium]
MLLRPISAASLIAFTLLGAPRAEAIDYKKDILPIFEKKCFECHGNGKSKGGIELGMDRVEGQIGTSVKPGDADKSVLYEVLVTDDEEELMPPRKKGGPLSKSEIAKVKEWIDAGAPLDAKAASEMAKDGGEEEGGDSPKRVAGVWTNKAGKKIEATLLEVKDGKAVLQLRNGKTYHYPLDQLSDESREKAENAGSEKAAGE